MPHRFVHVHFHPTSPKNRRGPDPDIPLFLKHLKDSLTTPKGHNTFGLLNSKYAKRFEEVWSEAESPLGVWAKSLKKRQRYGVLKRSRAFWTEDFPKHGLLSVLVRIPSSTPLLPGPLTIKPTYAPCSPRKRTREDKTLSTSYRANTKKISNMSCHRYV